MATLSQLLSLTKQLVAIPSIATDKDANKQTLLLMSKHLQDFTHTKFTSKGFVSYLYTNTKKPTKKFKLILNAHLDVVSGAKIQFKPTIRDKKLFGRGASDMKAAAAAMIYAFREIGQKVNYPLGLQLVTDEELDGDNGTAYQINQGVRADFVIAGEPTQFAIAHKLKGYVRMYLHFKGRAAHTGYPWKGENAIWEMHDFLTVLKKEFPLLRKEAWQTSATPSIITTSNTILSSIPNNITLGIDMRYIPEDYTGDDIVKKIISLLPKGATYEVVSNERAHATPKDNMYIKLLQGATRKILGNKSSTIVRHGSGDIRHYSEYGAHGVEFGPIGGNHHAGNEWVDIQSIEDYYTILKEFLISI